MGSEAPARESFTGCLRTEETSRSFTRSTVSTQARDLLLGWWRQNRPAGRSISTGRRLEVVTSEVSSFE